MVNYWRGCCIAVDCSSLYFMVVLSLEIQSTVQRGRPGCARLCRGARVCAGAVRQIASASSPQPPLGFGDNHTFAGPQANQVGLEFSDHAEDVEEKHPTGSAGM